MKVIALTQGLVALVDDADFEQLNRFKWRAHPADGKIYAGRTVTLSGHGIHRKRTTVLMHRQLLGLHGAIEGDHHDGNGLNNQRSNLRPATSQQNKHNRRKGRGVSKFKGVVWHRQASKWQAQICFRINGRLHNEYLGHFDSEIDAAKAYNVAATRKHKAFAKLNEL